jgi:hypothetical protein
MHQPSEAPAVTAPGAHDHSQHESPAATPADSERQLACGCPSDASSVYLGLAGICVAPSQLSPSTLVTMATPIADPSPIELELPFVSPPPRLLDSLLF